MTGGTYTLQGWSTGVAGRMPGSSMITRSIVPLIGRDQGARLERLVHPSRAMLDWDWNRARGKKMRAEPVDS